MFAFCNVKRLYENFLKTCLLTLPQDIQVVWINRNNYRHLLETPYLDKRIIESLVSVDLRNYILTTKLIYIIFFIKTHGPESRKLVFSIVQLMSKICLLLGQKLASYGDLTCNKIFEKSLAESIKLKALGFQMYYFLTNLYQQNLGIKLNLPKGSATLFTQT